MKKVSVLILSVLLPVLCNAATPWQKWGGTYVRLESDGNISCVSADGGTNCDWSNSTVVPAASTPALVCGNAHRKIWGETGYDTPNHWCNNAYGDKYAVWRRGDYFGFNVFFAENPAGDLMCASHDGINCSWGNLVNEQHLEKPVRPLICGMAHDAVWGANSSKAPGHWCQQARYTVEERDYSDRKWASEVFIYSAGWAGVGFGLTGTQRGAPESMSIGEKDGRKGLALMSLPRDQAWNLRLQDEAKKKKPANTLYTTADKELQDDLFMYSSARWVAAEAPAVVLHVYLPAGNTTSLRMPVKVPDNGVEVSVWPGIWLTPAGVKLRTLEGDYFVPNLTPSNAAGSWWTLGMKVTESGDIEYYATPDWRASPFDKSLLQGVNSVLTGSTAYKVTQQADAVVMVSNVIRNSSPVIIGDISYGKKAKGQQVNVMTKSEISIGE